MLPVKLPEKLYYFGMIILLAGIVLTITEINYSLIVYSLGLIPVFGIRVYNLIVSKRANRRKNLILFFSAVFLIIAGLAIFYNKSWWIIFIALSAILDFYISFRRFN